MNFTLQELYGYLAAECREIWWQLEAESSLLLYGGGVASVAALALGYIMYKKCSREQISSETDLAKVHYYAGCLPESNSTNACMELLMMNPSLVNVPLWKQHGISHGYTPFLRACWNNNFQLIHFMLKIGADINVSNSDGETALYLVAYRVSKSSSWDSRALKLLWEAGCSVDAVNVHNNSMLHLAAKAGNATLTRWLLLHGADPDIRNSFGYTPHSLALRKGSPDHLVVANLLRTPISNASPPQPRFSIEENGMGVKLFRSVSSPVSGLCEDANITVMV